MNTDKLQRHYDKLTDLERFRLTLAASERDDKSELRALWATAPEAIYTMSKLEYTRQFDRMERIGNATAKAILLNVFLSALAWGMEEAGSEPPRFGPDAPDFESTCAVFGRRALITWDALGAFCEGLGITRAQALNLPSEAGEQLEAAVEFAQGLVDRDRRLMKLFTDKYYEETGQGDAEAVNAERTAEAAKYHADAVASNVAWLWEVWRGEE